MSNLEQLEQLVLELSSEGLAKFRKWFIELDHQLWDKQIEADVAAGKLDRLIAEARAEFKAGKVREKRSRLASESSQLHPPLEKAMADEGMPRMSNGGRNTER